MDTKGKTLVILTPGFPANEADSSCLPSQQIFVKALKRKFPALTVVILAFQYPFVYATYNWNGNRVVSFNGRNRGAVYKLITWARVWQRLLQLRKQNNVLGILSFWCNEAALIGTYFGWLYRIKHYCWILGQDAKKDNKLVKFIRPKPS